MKIFVPVVGQFTNVGDVLHRRELLSWLKDVGELHIYLGNAPKSFIEGLKLDSNAILYTSLKKWLWMIFCSGYKKTTFVFNPGEIRLGRRRLIGEIALFPIQLLVRLKRGEVLRVGIAAMSNSSKNFLWLWKFLFMPATQIYWRTFHSKEMFNRGKVIPDLAFYDIAETNFSDSTRKDLTISMRADCTLPSEKWFNAISEFSKDFNLNINVVSQVRMDNTSTVEIARKLNARSVVWPDETSHFEQEKILTEIYLKTKLVLSDRLHVLIAAYSKGAIPANILSVPSQKVQHHFSVLNLNNISIVESEYDHKGLYLFLEEKIKGGKFFEDNLLKSKKMLEDVRLEILESITKK
jgi:hypothetical protein